MKKFIDDIENAWNSRPFIWPKQQFIPNHTLNPPTAGAVLALSPHPDDPESAAILLRYLRMSGLNIWYTIVTISPAGVDEQFVENASEMSADTLKARKEQIRRREQIEAAKLFRLDPERLTFLDIDEKPDLDTPKNRAKVIDHLTLISPDIVVLPIGTDTNNTHVWVYQTFRDYALNSEKQRKKPLIALYNEDPKTTEINDDLFILFSEKDARWKRSLLRIHNSQQHRNIKLRSIGFDERIIEVNRKAASRLRNILEASKPSAEFTESYQIEIFRCLEEQTTDQSKETDLDTNKGRCSMSLRTEVCTMIAEALSIDESEVVDDAHLQDDLGADSLMLVELAEAFGSRYRIGIDPDDLIDATNIIELFQLIEGKISSN